MSLDVADGTIVHLTPPTFPSYDDLIAQVEPFVAAEHEWSALSASSSSGR